MAEAAPPANGNIVVVVRAPNQEIQDFEVACPSTWNVVKLKEHLQENYQGNPVPSDQKLIYSGQLLEDEAVLRDVLRHEGASPSRHTVHLVCRPPKGVPETRRRTNMESARHLPNGSPQTSPVASFTPEFSTHQSTSGDTQNEIRYRVPTNQNNIASTYSAPILAMQNMYAQYYQQLLLHHQAALNSRTTPAAANYLFNPCGFNWVTMRPEQMLYWQNAQIPLLNQQNFNVPEVNNDNNNNNNNNNNFIANNNNLNNNNNNNNNNNVNNNINNNMAEDENVREWEDYIYLAARIGLLVMLVYFYSSVEKLILMSGLGLLFFFYQQLRAGLQDQGNAAAAAAANPGNPPMAGDPAVNRQPAARERHDIDRLQAAMDGENAPPAIPPAAPGVVPGVVVQQSPVAAAANFLRAFFVSLIP